MLSTICERLSKQIPGYTIFVDVTVAKYRHHLEGITKEEAEPEAEVTYKVIAVNDGIVFQSRGSYLCDAADDVLRQYKESLTCETETETNTKTNTDTNSNKDVEI